MAEPNTNTNPNQEPQGGENNTNTNTNTNTNQNGTGEKSYTEEQVLALIQSETQKALEKQKKDYEKQLSLSKLDENARAKAEDKMKIEELEQKLAEFQIEKNRSELKSVLSARGLSAEFADIISISDDLKQSQANIDKLDKLFKKAVQDEVERRIAGNTPKGGSGSSSPMTKDEFLKLPLYKMNELMNSNPDFYSNLLK